MEEKKNIPIFGASLTGILCYNELIKKNINVPFFIDNYLPSQKTFSGVNVYRVEEAISNNKLFSNIDAVIIASTGHAASMRKQLLDIQFNKPIIEYIPSSPIRLDGLNEKYFFINHCLLYDHSFEDKKILNAVGEFLGKNHSELIFIGAGKLCRYMLQIVPDLQSKIKFIVDSNPELNGKKINGIPIIFQDENVYNGNYIFFLCSTKWLSLVKMKKHLPENAIFFTIEIIKEIDSKIIPQRAYKMLLPSIYPIEIPEIKFQKNLDLILLDLPPKLLAGMPYGLGHVHNILKTTNFLFQTIDIDIIIYHRYHSQRILDGLEKIISSSGYELKEDLWDVNGYNEWDNDEVINYFKKDIEEIIDSLVDAHPKIVGISLHLTNLKFAKKIVEGVRKKSPDIIFIVGGYSCVNACVGLKIFPEADYMIIGEAELTLEPLLKLLLNGEKIKNFPGVISRFDTPERIFEPAALLNNLDSIDFPHYDWTDISIYRNYNGSQTVPILISRGCRWSKCNFCGECFKWRKRSADKIFEELLWLVNKGCSFFFFNESDFNSDPKLLLELCDKIIDRRLNVQLSGQLRLHKHSDKYFFDKLKKAGFISLNFGVDAWSKNTLRRQMKGYTIEMIKNNLKESYEAGIRITANVLIGVPGETDEDIEETIDNIISCKNYISEMTAFNVLILAAGSKYYKNPELYNIHFRGDQKQIYLDNPHCIPPALWYSKNPYIDHIIRLKRLKKIIEELKKNNVNIGKNSTANIDRTIKELEKNNLII